MSISAPPRRSVRAALLLAVGLVLAPAITDVPTTSAQSVSMRSLADRADVRVGAAVDGDGLGDDSYRALLAEQANLVSTRSDLSMAVVQPERGSFDFARAEAIVDFAVEIGVPVRGHELIGGAVPGWVSGGDWTAETLGAVLREHVSTVMGHFRDRNPGVVTQWDVVGDAFLPDGSPRPTVWHQVIGDDYVRLAFEAAREADPNAALFYDDFYDDLSVTQDAVASGVGIVPGANAERSSCDAVVKCVAVRDRIGTLVADGAPIDGIGFQSHLFSPDPTDFGEFSGWVGELGLRWAVTEFDVPLPITEVDNPDSLAFQADIYADALGACVDDPGCDTFVTWGISDRFSPIPAETGGAFGGALWFDENDAPKPAFDAMASVLEQRAAPTTTAAPVAPAESAAPTTSIGPARAGGESSSSAGLVVIGLAGLGLVVVGAMVIARRRRGGAPSP